MKNLLVLISFFYINYWSGVKNDFIIIEYVGDADKPMPVVWISKKSIPWSDRKITINNDDYGLNEVVRNNEFLFIKKAVKTTDHKIFEKKRL